MNKVDMLLRLDKKRWANKMSENPMKLDYKFEAIGNLIEFLERT
jgi:hypothetical protein